MSDPAPNVYSQLSTPDLEAYVEGRFDKMSDAGKEIAGVSLPSVMPSLLPSPADVRPGKPLSPPSGGFLTPEQIGTFAADEGMPAGGQWGGAVLGAKVGGMAPGPLKLLTVPLFAGAGAVLGKYGGNYVQGKDAPTPPELADTYKAGVLTESGGQIATHGLPFLQRSLMGAPSSVMSPATEEAVRLSDKYAVPLTGGQATGSAPLQAIEQSIKVPIGSRPVVEFGEAQRKAAAEAVDRLRASVAGAAKTDVTAAGESVGRGLKAAKDAAHAMREQLYQAAEDAAAGITVTGENRIKAATAFLAKEGMVAPGLQSGTGNRVAQAAKVGRATTPAEAASAAQDVNGMVARLSQESPDALTALEAELKANPDGFRAALKAQLPDAEKDLGDILNRLAEPRPMTYAQTRDLYHRISDQIEKVGAETYTGKRLMRVREAINLDVKEEAARRGGDFAAKLDAANTYASDVYFAQFDKDSFSAALRKAAKDNPSLVVDRLLSSDVSGIAEIKRILSQNGPAWKDVQSQVFQDMAARAQADVGEVGGQVGQRFSVRKWLNMTEGATGPFGADRLKAMLEPDQYATLQEMNRLFRVIDKGSGPFFGGNPGTAGTILSHAQLNAILGGTAFGLYDAAQGDLQGSAAWLGSAAAAAAVPSTLSRVLMSKGARDIIARSTVKATGWAAKAARLTGAGVRGGARLLTEPVSDAMVSVPPMNPSP
jgi:hypothetical protein